MKLLEDPTPEKAAELIEKLPSLLPEDPALAAVIAEAMAEEFGSVANVKVLPKPNPNTQLENGNTGTGNNSTMATLSQQEAEKIWDDIMGDDE